MYVLGLQEAVKFYFCDSDIWPLQNSVYYLGHIPKLDSWVSKEAFDSTMICKHFLQTFTETFTWWKLVQKRYGKMEGRCPCEWDAKLKREGGRWDYYYIF